MLMEELTFDVLYISSSCDKKYAEDVTDDLKDGDGWISSRFLVLLPVFLQNDHNKAEIIVQKQLCLCKASRPKV